MKEFRVTEDCLLPLGKFLNFIQGFQLSSRHFIPGQYVDVTGVTKGKGFQGVIKRWGFKGQPATHGTSVSHRSHGSTGQQGAQHTFKGKKMAGRMGGKKKYTRNLFVYMIDKKMNCVFVKGSVPGPNGTYITIEDSHRKKKLMIDNPPPFPGFTVDPNESFENVPFEETLLKARFKRPQEWSGFNEKGDEIQETDEQIWNYVSKVREAIEETGEIPPHLAVLDGTKKK
jgi:large subunit ribosomal protein L3